MPKILFIYDTAFLAKPHSVKRLLDRMNEFISLYFKGKTTILHWVVYPNS